MLKYTPFIDIILGRNYHNGITPVCASSQINNNDWYLLLIYQECSYSRFSQTFFWALQEYCVSRNRDPTYPMLLSVALLAYTLGLRHSVDADHISAMDNVMRERMQENKRPVGFFSLNIASITFASEGARHSKALRASDEPRQLLLCDIVRLCSHFSVSPSM